MIRKSMFTKSADFEARVIKAMSFATGFAAGVEVLTPMEVAETVLNCTEETEGQTEKFLIWQEALDRLSILAHGA